MSLSNSNVKKWTYHEAALWLDIKTVSFSVSNVTRKSMIVPQRSKFSRNSGRCLCSQNIVAHPYPVETRNWESGEGKEARKV